MQKITIVSEVSGECKSSVYVLFGEYNIIIFVVKKLLNCKMNTVFLHSDLPGKSLKINLPFIVYKVSYSELPNKLALKGCEKRN